MTKLTPIEELAKRVGFYLDCDDMNISHEELESLRQAIISDFVSKIEPVHSQFFDIDKWYDYLNEKHKKNTIEAGYLHRDLYSLPEWITK